MRIKNASLALAGLGVICLLCYLAFNFLVPQSPGYMANSRAVLNQRLPLWSAIMRMPLPIPNTALAVVSIVTATTIITMSCYVLALWINRRTDASRLTAGIVLGFTVVFFMTSVLTLPNFSGDVYAYVQRARVYNVYQANPYSTPPTPTSDDPYLLIRGPMHNPTPYGPAWTYLSILLQRLAGEDVVHNLMAFRALLFGFNLANLVLIWNILGHINPAHRLTGLLFYGWNPIVVLKGQDHLDPVMAFFVLACAYLYVARREWLAVAALALSVLTKLITAPLVVVYVIHLWRNRSFRAAVVGAGLVGAIASLAFLPFWEGYETVWRLLRQPHDPRPGSLFSARRILFSPGFLVAILWVSLRWPATAERLLAGWAVVLLWFSLFLMPTFYSWYLLTIIAVVSLVDRYSIVAMTLTICFTALLTNSLGLTVTDYVTPSVWVFRFIWWVPPLLMLAWLYRAKLSRLPRLADSLFPRLRGHRLQ